MTYNMVSISKKTVRGKTYYYARECRRVDGKPKIVWQKYLGKAEDIVAALSQPQAASPQAALVTEFGALAALFDLAQRLRLVEHIDRHVPDWTRPHRSQCWRLSAGRCPQSGCRAAQQGANRRLV